MRKETAISIRMLAAADPETSPEQLMALEKACGLMAQGEDEFVSQGTACRILGVSRTTIFRMERDGFLRGYHVGGRRVRYSRQELMDAMRQGTRR